MNLLRRRRDRRIIIRAAKPERQGVNLTALLAAMVIVFGVFYLSQLWTVVGQIIVRHFPIH